MKILYAISVPDDVIRSASPAAVQAFHDDVHRYVERAVRGSPACKIVTHNTLTDAQYEAAREHFKGEG